MSQTFEDMELLRQIYQETNDCTVKAIAAACDVSYGKAHRTLAKLGRKQGRGVTMATMTQAMERLGFGVNLYNAMNHEAIGTTIKRFTREHATGKYIICSKGHAMAVVNGELIDWTADTAGRRKVVSVWEVK